MNHQEVTSTAVYDSGDDKKEIPANKIAEMLNSRRGATDTNETSPPELQNSDINNSFTQKTVKSSDEVEILSGPPKPQEYRSYKNNSFNVMVSGECEYKVANMDMFDECTLNNLVKLINDIYDVAEDGMWKQKGVRTDQQQLMSLINDHSLIVAVSQNTIKGLVKVLKMENDTQGEFGMLVVNPEFRGKRLGSGLIKAAEDWAREWGAKTMRLELLTPRTWKHPDKEFLKEWYTRLGYVPQRTEQFEQYHPYLIEKLKTECDFTVWLKPLN